METLKLTWNHKFLIFDLYFLNYTLSKTYTINIPKNLIFGIDKPLDWETVKPHK